MHKINADKRKSKEGITLIALIITIIVMLILVGVTITVAMQGGLFDTAREGAKGTEIEADREILQGALVGALDKEELKIKTAKSIEDNLPKGWKVDGNEGGPYTVRSAKENVFIVTATGEILDENSQTAGNFERYVLGENLEGRNLEEILDFESMTFKDDETTPEDEVETLKVEFLNIGRT